MIEPTQELKDIASFAARDAGWQFTGLQYHGVSAKFRPLRIVCTHGIEPLSFDPSSLSAVMPAVAQETTLEPVKIAAHATGKVTPVLVGVCPGGVLHYCDIEHRE